MNTAQLAAFYDRGADAVMADTAWPLAHAALLAALEDGSLRAAHRDADVKEMSQEPSGEI